jgi:DNA invertase Pin-like site-specific DNA recombinase
MPNPIDLSEDPFFKKAFAEAEAKGYALGKFIGETNYIVELIIRLLHSNRLKVKEIARITSTSKAFVSEIKKMMKQSYEISKEDNI